MKTNLPFRQRLASLQLVAVLILAGGAAFAEPVFTSKNGTSDILGVASYTDGQCTNPWGLVTGTAGNLHVADNGLVTGSEGDYDVVSPGVATSYAPNGLSIAFSGTQHSIAIPSVSSFPTGSPTGAAENLYAILTGTDTDFPITATSTGPSNYLFCTEDGAIEGYNQSVDLTSAVVGFTGTSGQGYTGMALSWQEVTVAGVTTLDHRAYAANFAQETVDEFDSSFNPVQYTGTDNFTDPNPPAVPNGAPEGSTWSPFNIHTLDYTGKDDIGNNLVPHTSQTQRRLIVAYALHNKTTAPLADISGYGGFIDLYYPNGQFDRRLVTLGQDLDSPWGMAVAHSPIYGLLHAPIVILVGNHGNGQIHAYAYNPGDPSLDGLLLGTMIKNIEGDPLAFDGLWTLHFGPIPGPERTYLKTLADLSEDHGNLYFSAGIVHESRGLVGQILLP